MGEQSNSNEDEKKLRAAADEALHIVAMAAQEAARTVAAAAATAVAAATSGRTNDDHDLLIELKTRMEGLKVDIKDLKDGTAVKIVEHEKKIDTLFEKFDELPCDGRGKEIEAIQKDIGWVQKILWWVLTIGVPALVILAVAWGALTVTVSRNTGVIHELQIDDQNQVKPGKVG